MGLSYTNWFSALPWTNVWGHPSVGYYLSSDEKTIHYHLQIIARANVDFLFLDLSNEINADWITRKGEQRSLDRLDNTIKLLEALREARNLKISFLTGGNPPEVVDDGRLQKHVDDLCKLFIFNEKYGDLFLTRQGKPLLTVFLGPSTTGQIGKPRGPGRYVPDHWPKPLPPWSDSRLTVRYMGGFLTDQPNLMNGPISKYGYWSWEDRGLPSYTVVDGQPEEMTVTAASQSSPAHPARPRDAGQTFRENWAYARKIGPQIALVTTFNEWWRGEQHDPEFSRDVEPSQEFGDLYMKILGEEAELFKQGK